MICFRYFFKIKQLNFKPAYATKLFLLLFPFISFAQQFDELPKLDNVDNSLVFITPIFGAGLSPYIYKASTEGEELGGVAEVIRQYRLDWTLKVDLGLLVMLDTRLLNKGEKLLVGYGIEYEWMSEPEIFSGVISNTLNQNDVKHISIQFVKHYFRVDYIIKENRDGLGIFAETGLFNTFNDIGYDINDKFFVTAGGMVFWRLVKGLQLFAQAKVDYTHYKSTIPYDLETIQSTNHNISLELAVGLRFGLFNNKIIW